MKTSVSVLYDEDDRLPIFGYWISSSQVFVSDGHGGCEVLTLPTTRKVLTLPITNISAVWQDKFYNRLAIATLFELLIIETTPELRYSSHELPPAFNKQWTCFFNNSGELFAVGDDSSFHQYTSEGQWRNLGECRLRDPSVGAGWFEKCIIGSKHGQIEILQLTPFKSLSISQKHADSVQDIAPINSNIFVTVARDRRISLWSLAKNFLKEIWSIPNAHEHFINCAVTVGSNLWTGSSDGFVSVRPLKNPDHFWRQQFHDDAIRALVVSPDKKYILSTSDDGLHKIISTSRQPVEKFSIGKRRAYMSSADTIPKINNTFFAIGKSDGTIILGNISNRSLVVESQQKLFKSNIRSIKFINCNNFVCGIDSGLLSIVSDNIIINSTKSLKDGSIYSIAIGNNGNDLWLGRKNGIIEHRKIPSLKLLSKMKVHSSIVGDLIIKKGNELISCSDDRSISLLRSDNADVLQRLSLVSSAINNLLCFEDSEGIDVLVATSDDCIVYLIDLEAYEIIAKYTEHISPVRAACIIGKGLVATGDRSGWVKIWNIKDRKTIYSEFFGSRITRISFVSTQKSIILFTERHIIKLDCDYDDIKFPIVNRRRSMPKFVNMLHVSDLHFGTENDAKTWQSQLGEDLRNELNCKHIDLIVVSGDIGTLSTDNEYKAAKHFFDLMKEEFGINNDGILIVPGNHDIDWAKSEQSYSAMRRKDYHGPYGNEHVIDNGEYVEVLDSSNYLNRFNNYSEFLQELFGEPYPVEYENQFSIKEIADGRILVIGFNSAWQLDHYYRNRASIHPVAIANALNFLRKNSRKSLLKIAAWHHPIHSEEDSRIKDVGFLEQLAKADFKIGLHGHIHKSDKRAFNYDVGSGGRKIECVAAGTFGAPRRGWTPGYPLQYNCLRIDLDGFKVIVETRRREEINGAWKPDARWTKRKGKDPEPRYIIEY